MIANTTTRSLFAAAFCVLLTGAAAAQGTWSKQANPAPRMRSEVAVVDANGKIYEIGGGTFVGEGENTKLEQYASPLVQEYDPVTDKWRDLAPLPEGLSHAGAAILNGKIYVAGGFTIIPPRGVNVHLGAVDHVFAYDIAKNSWEKLTPLPSPRGSIGLAAAAGKIHAIAGRGPDQNTIGTHDVYDPATGKWTSAAPLPVSRDHLGIITLNDRIHVLGGRDTPNVNVALHDIFDPATGKWIQAEPMPTARSSGAIAIYRGLLFYTGGECKDQKAFAVNEAFDPKTGKWTTLAPLPETRHAFGAATVGDTLYFVGGTHGCGGRNPATDVLSFKLP